jgi:tetratricopeptide (TPR) repeat protein
MLSKSAAVCFPGVVLLLDWFLGRKISTKLILEKIPFFIVSLIFGIVAIYSQKDIGAIQNLGPLFSFFDRILLSFYAVVMYIEKFIVPLGLSAMHPYPEVIGNHLQMKVYIAPLIVLALLIPVVLSFRKTKMIVFGTIFFFINIALVLQLLPVGAAIIAERYSYVPYIGFFMMIGYGYMWIAENKKESIKKLKTLILIILSGWVLFLGITSFNRIKVWQRGDYLFEDILLSYQNQPFVYSNLGFLCFNELKDYDRALLNYNRCVAVDSTFEVVYCNRGILYFNMQKYKEAIKDFDKALLFNPANANALIGRANTLSSLNMFDKALVDYNTFITLIENNPNKYQIASNLTSAYHWRGVAESNLGKNDDAIRDFNKVLDLEPQRYESYYWRGLAYNNKKMLPQAIQDLSKAITIEPSKSEYYAWRGLLNYNVHNVQASIDDYTKAIQLNPKDLASYANRALSYKDTKQWEKALADLDIVTKMGYPVQKEYYESVKQNVRGK